ncbi:hypothetical protein CBS101457_000829 [Exobasidium rhododendri]|nr:hypothetical protein CBS101457_000829 [Exobasidium rhododendri]
METEGVSTGSAVCAILLLAYYTLIWSISLLGLSQARHKFGRPTRNTHRSLLPHLHSATPSTSIISEGEVPTVSKEGISILRPLAGLDHNLLTNLASSFEQDFPPHLFEVILSVRNEQDQALDVAREVCSRYPHIQSTIIIGDEGCSGVNPKIANLVRSYAASQFDIIWVLDSQVQLSALALHRAIQAMHSSPPIPSPRILNRRPHGSRVGLAHHVPLAVTPHSTSLGSHIEAIFLGTNHAKMYLAINSLSVDSCVMGKSNFYRKSDLASVSDDFFKVGVGGTRGESGAIGSIAFQQPTSSPPSQGGEDTLREGDIVSNGIARPLARFGIFLAEDNMLALSLWRPPLSLGHVLLDGDVARMTVGDVKSIADYAKRRIRWIRVRRYMVPAATYVEPLTESIVCGIIATWAFTRFWLPLVIGKNSSSYLSEGFSGSVFFFLHLLSWHLVDFAVIASLQEAGRDTRSSSRGNIPTQVIDFSNSRQVWTFRLAWICRELLAFPIWVTALCGSTVTWRDRKYRILTDARAARVDADDRNTASSSPSSSSLSTLIPRLFGYQADPRRKRYERLSTTSGEEE